MLIRWLRLGTAKVSTYQVPEVVHSCNQPRRAGASKSVGAFGSCISAKLRITKSLSRSAAAMPGQVIIACLRHGSVVKSGPPRAILAVYAVGLLCDPHGGREAPRPGYTNRD